MLWDKFPIWDRLFFMIMLAAAKLSVRHAARK